MGNRSQQPRTAAILVAVAALSGSLVERSVAQGCEPIRFMTPNAGLQNWSLQQAGQWKLALGYRYLYSDQWFVGSTEDSQRAPGGQSPVIRTNTFVADVEYAFSDRLAVHVSVPFSTGTIRRVYPAYDAELHEQEASGIGDMTVSADLWLMEPSSHQTGNLAFGLGVQLPTGRNEVASSFYTANGPVPFAADQAIQPGGGGWALSLQTRAFLRLFERGFGYLSGAYAFTPEASTNVSWQPGRELWAVADGYSGRLGLAYSLLPDAGVSVSLGGRIDGTPVRDVLGGGEEAYRRPGYVVYADPGIALSRGRNYLSLNLPLRLHANRLKNTLEQESGQLNGGGFAKALIFLTYSRRL